MKFFNGIRIATILATLAMSNAAYATTVGIDECSTVKPNGTPSATFTHVTSFLAECYSGKTDTVFITDTTKILGMTGWSLHKKLDAGTSGDDFNFSTGLAAQGNSAGGQIFADLSKFDFAFVALKAAKGFGAFLVSTKDTSWDWSSNIGISHVSIWTKNDGGDDNEPEPVPLPAGGALLLSALALIGIRKRLR